MANNNNINTESSMTTFALSKRPRTVRAKFPKVRTGCITCKKRHVKCDEAKPGCMRCLKWIGHCSGYSYEINNTGSASSTPEPMQSTTHSTQPTPRSDRSEDEQSGSPSSGAGSSPDDGHRISPLPKRRKTLSPSPPLIHAQVVPQEEGSLGEEFWMYTVPELVQEHSAVMAANKAVHALMLAKQPSLMSADAGSGQRNYSEALKWYDFALREVQSSLYSLDVRPAILCSMFFVIFETVHGDQKAAASHLYNGQRILDELTFKTAAASETGQDILSVRKELGHLAKFLAQQIRENSIDLLERDMESLERCCQINA